MYSTNRKNCVLSTRTSDKKLQTKTVSARTDEKTLSAAKKSITAGSNLYNKLSSKKILKKVF